MILITQLQLVKSGAEMNLMSRGSAAPTWPDLYSGSHPPVGFTTNLGNLEVVLYVERGITSQT